MSESYSPIARAAIFEIIENQLRDRTPPETKQTYDRLIADGYSHDETMKLLGFVVACEISDVLRERKPFNLPRYVVALNALPELPWDDEEE